MEKPPPTPFAVFRFRFTWIVLAACAIGWIVTALRSEENWPKFSPPPDVAFAAFAAPDEPAELSGMIVDADGSPTSDALVEILANGYPHWAWTNARGRFRIAPLPLGHFEAVLHAEGYAPTVLEVDVAAANPPVRWALETPLRDLVALPAMGRAPLVGRIAPSVGSSIGRCEVVLVPLPTDTITGAVPRRALADGDGDFEVPDLVLAKYELRVLPPWAEGGSWPVLARVEIDHRDGREVAPVTLQSGRIALRATGRELGAVAGAVALVREKDRPGRIWPPVVTSETGSASVGDLPAGRYLIQLRAGARLAEREIDLGPGELLGVDFEPLDLSAP